MDARLALRCLVVLALAASAAASAVPRGAPERPRGAPGASLASGAGGAGPHEIAHLDATGAAPGRLAVCFAPGTSLEEVERFAQEQAAAAGGSAGDPGIEGAQYQFSDGSRWSWTATDGCCLVQGQPTTITYSFVPDGTAMSSGVGEPAAASNLFAFLDGIYGDPAVWMPLFHQVFARWSELTGIRYVYQPSDDGAAFPGSSGLVGVRGDVRIAGHPVNGTGGVIAYNWYPNVGDMVLDTGDANYGYTASQSLLLRNVVAHEHGHGLGIRHNCPINQTKLMEPTATLAFVGPQHDDVLAAQRGYGDPLESNGTPATATDLGVLGDGALAIDGVSIDDADDADLFKLTVPGGKRLTATLTPVGASYLQAAQDAQTGACPSGTSVDSRIVQDLAIDLLTADGATVLATAAATPAGVAESLAAFDFPSSGAYYVRVRGSGASGIQIYDLDLSLAETPGQDDVIFEDDFEAADLSGWDVKDASGQLGVGPSAALEGGSGLQITLGASRNSHLVDRHPDGEESYRVRFLLDATSYVSPSDTSRPHLLRVFSKTPKTRWMIDLRLRVVGGQAQLQARVRKDGPGVYHTPFLPVSNAPHEIELDWRKATAPGADDGHFELRIDGTPATTWDDLDTDLQLVKFARFGYLAGSTSAAGALRLDGYRTMR